MLIVMGKVLGYENAQKKPKIFLALLTILSTEDPQSLRMFLRLVKEAFEAMFTLFIYCLCLQKFTLTLDDVI